MASSNGTSFGASIVPIDERADTKHNGTNITLHSPAMTPAASHEDLTNSNYPQPHIPPTSPIYQAPAPTHVRQPSKPTLPPNEKDSTLR